MVPRDRVRLLQVPFTVGRARPNATALQWLEEAFEDRDVRMTFLPDHKWNKPRVHEPFPALLARMRLAAQTTAIATFFQERLAKRRPDQTAPLRWSNNFPSSNRGASETQLNLGGRPLQHQRLLLSGPRVLTDEGGFVT
jgi:hypothetical protein